MEWLKTSLLVFILFIFTVKNVKSSPIVVASIETKPTVTPKYIHEQRVLGQLEDGNKMLKELEKAGLIRQKVPKDPSESGFGDKEDTVVQRMRRASDYQDLAIRNNRYGNSNYESNTIYSSTSTNKPPKMDTGIVVALSLFMFLLFIFGCILPIGLIVGVVYLILYLVKQEERNRVVIPMNNGGNRFPNGQIQNNLAQKSSATLATASKTAATRSSATPRSSEVAGEIGMDKKAKTEVSSSNVEENKN